MKKKRQAPQYNSPASQEFAENATAAEKKFYDKQFRVWHTKVLVALGVILAGLYFLVYNGRTIVSWFTS